MASGGGVRARGLTLQPLERERGTQLQPLEREGGGRETNPTIPQPIGTGQTGPVKNTQE